MSSVAFNSLYAFGLGVINLFIKALLTIVLIDRSSFDDSNLEHRRRVAFLLVVVVYPLLDEVIRLSAISVAYYVGCYYTLFMICAELNLGLSVGRKVIAKTMLGLGLSIVQWICFVMLAKHSTVAGLFITWGMHSGASLVIIAFCERYDST